MTVRPPVEYSTTTLGRGRKPAVLLAPAFTFFVPGRVIVTNWTRMASWSRVAMPTVLSLSRLTLVATIALWAHAWHPISEEIGMGLGALPLLGLQIFRDPVVRQSQFRVKR